MKARKQCPKCSSLKVGYMESVMDWGPPFYTPSVRKVAGDFEVLLCGDCGYFETYLKDPAMLSRQIEGFRWLNTEQEAPYR